MWGSNKYINSNLIINNNNKRNSETSVNAENVNNSSEKRTFFKLSDKFNSNSSDFKSVKSLKNYWDNRIKLLSSSVPEQLNKDFLDSHAKSATLTAIPSVTAAASRHNNCSTVKARSTTLDSVSAKNYLNSYKSEESGGINSGRSRRSDVLSKFVPFYSAIFKSSPKDQKSDSRSSVSTTPTQAPLNPKRTAIELSDCNSPPVEIRSNTNINKRFRPNSDIIHYSNFPLIAATPSGSKIHWAKREDIFAKRNLKKQQQQQQQLGQDTVTTPEKVHLSDAEARVPTSECVEKPVIDKNNKLDNKNSKMSIKTKEKVSADNSGEQRELDAMLLADDKMLSHADKFVQNNNSRNSTISSTTSGLETPRKTSNSTRKYSFKTNTVSPYHKKMSGSTGGSKVAALTLRFNQMIQQDVTLLEEVKRRGRTLHKTGNHVYKIKEESDSLRRKSFKNDENSDCNSSMSSRSGTKKHLVKKRPSIRAMMQSQQNSDSSNAKTNHSVKDTIQLFEPHLEKVVADRVVTLKRNDSSTSNSSIKPKIPDKSELVKKKTKDLQHSKIKSVINKSATDNELKTSPSIIESPKLAIVSNSISSINNNSHSVKKVLKSAIKIQIQPSVLEEHELMSIHMKSKPSTVHSQAEEMSERAVAVSAKANEIIPTVSGGEVGEEHMAVADTPPVDLPTVESQSLASDLEARTEDEQVVPYSGKFKKKSPEESKNKLAKIYEKLRFRPFFSGPKNLSIKSDLKLSQSTPVLSQAEVKSEEKKETAGEKLNPDQNLVDAICSVSEKIDSISKSANCINVVDEVDTPAVQPNQSFLFRSTSKRHFYSTCDISEDNEEIVEAVNNVVVNKTQSMDELVFPQAINDGVAMPSGLEDFMDMEEYAKNNLEMVLPKHDEILEKTEIEKIDSFVYVSENLCSDALMEEEGEEEEIDTDPVYSNHCDNIYQTLPSATTIKTSEDQFDNVSVNSYESFEQNNYEAVEDFKSTYPICTTTKSSTHIEDEYEICDPPEPPPPRKLPSATSNEFALPPPQRNVSNNLSGSNICLSNYERIKYDDIPARPPKSPNLQQKSPIVPLPPRNSVAGDANNQFSLLLTHQQQSSNIHHEDENEYEENIYDFIKHSDDHRSSSESLIKNNIINANNSNKNASRKSDDALSILSNCYESINLKHDFIRHNGLHHAASLTTLSSDHKTNSLYGMSGIQSITPPSERGSDASDEWVDISDEEDDHTKMKFIITREKSKCHRSPDWSRKVRDKRIHQMLDDVSVTSPSSVYLTTEAPERAAAAPTGASDGPDPVYENAAPSAPLKDDGYWNKSYNLCPFRIVEPFLKHLQILNDGGEGVGVQDKQDISQPQTQTASGRQFELQTVSVFIDDTEHLYEPLIASHHQNQDRINEEIMQLHKNTSQSSPVINNNHNHSFKSNNHYNSPKIPYNTSSALTENEDDFDSFDSDLESDEDLNNKIKTDSGVDISNTKLPDPPAATGQVYAFMQKIKNFGTLSKYELSKGLSKISKKKSSSSLKTSQQDLSATSNGSQSKDGTYDDNNYYANSTFGDKKQSSSSGRLKYLKSFNKKSTKSLDPYENTEFHKPITPTTPLTPTTPVSPLSIVSEPASSPKPPNAAISNKISSESCINEKSKLFENLTRRKSKSDKNFRSKLRKSLASDYSLNLGNSLNGTRSTFYITDSVDVDSGFYADRLMISEELNSSKTGLNDTVSSTQPEVPARNTSKTVSTSSPDLGRRRSTFSNGRPNNPPPPPPTTAGDKKSVKAKQLGKTSWYAECGVFKSESLENCKTRHMATSWYADAGLYQTSGISVASSSGSSGVSTGGECGPGDDNSHSMFLNEPLYQIYSAAKLASLSCGSDADHSDGYEEVGENKDGKKEVRPSRPSALQLIEPNQGRPSRTLWSEVSEVIKSELLSALSPTEKKLQEAKFEILTSEASYLKSLNLLKIHFMYHPSLRDQNILSSADRKTLFSFITPVLECSDRLLCDLESCWQDNIMLLGMSHSIYKHAEKHFQIYISYCENQGKLDRTLRRLKETKGPFTQAIELLESEPSCCSLSLHSFLMLPMQRITRLPLLVDAVLSKLQDNDNEYESWKMTLAILNKIVANCNDAANRSEQAYEMECISRQIEFPTNICPVAIIPVGTNLLSGLSRTLVKRGELTHLVWRGEDAKLTFGKRFAKNPVYAFLFTDIFVLTKRKSEDSYVVIDHCPRSLLNVSSGDVIPQLPTKEMLTAGKHLILLTLLENYEGKTIEMILSCATETERQRWLKVTEPVCSENPEEKLYEQWDCPQVQAKHHYQALQPDELNLEIGDIVNVTRKMVDGWYHGERIRDGVVGWFPGNFVQEVASQHVRAKNLKQRYRLLTFTGSYLESQKSKK